MKYYLKQKLVSLHHALKIFDGQDDMAPKANQEANLPAVLATPVVAFLNSPRTCGSPLQK